MRFDPVPGWPRWAKITAVAVGVLVVLGVIGALGDDKTPTTPAAAPTASATATAGETTAAKTTKPVKAAGCVKVPASIGAGIATGAEHDPMKFTALAAWKSPDFPNVYFVAGKWDLNGVGSTTGVWATNHIDEAGSIMAVDAVAQEFTEWPDADSTDAEISKVDPGVKKATDCLS